MNRVPSKQRNANIRRDRDLRALNRLALLLCCGLVLAGGFVFAAQQYFTAIQYGYKSESLRRERERLAARRLVAEERRRARGVDGESAPVTGRMRAERRAERRCNGACSTDTGPGTGGS